MNDVWEWCTERSLHCNIKYDNVIEMLECVLNFETEVAKRFWIVLS